MRGHTGIGFLPNQKLELMEGCCKRLSERADEHQSNVPHNPLIHTYSINLRRTLSRLRAIGMMRREVLFECRQVQRQWLELWALLDYKEVYKPRMEGHVAPAKETANAIGCFVQEAESAERLFFAGIPYWIIRPITSFTTENILSITTVFQPKDVLELEDYIHPFPLIYVGDSNYCRFRAISEHGLKSLRYTDLFSDGNPKGIKPHEFEEAGPSRPQRNSNNRSQPCKPFYFALYVSLIRSQIQGVPKHQNEQHQRIGTNSTRLTVRTCLFHWKRGRRPSVLLIGHQQCSSQKSS